MVTSNTKRRLLLSRWEAARDEERDWQAAVSERDEQIRQLEDVVLHVKYWMQDVLVHHRPMTDPRKILTMLERAI